MTNKINLIAIHLKSKKYANMIYIGKEGNITTPNDVMRLLDVEGFKEFYDVDCFSFENSTLLQYKFSISSKDFHNWLK